MAENGVEKEMSESEILKARVGEMEGRRSVSGNNYQRINDLGYEWNIRE